MLSFVSKSLRQQRDILLLTISAATAQVINILVLSYFTRAYGAAAIGELSVVITLATYLSIISTGRYELGIILQSNKEKSGRLVVFTFLLCFLVNIAAILILLAANYLFPSLIKTKLLLLAPLVSFLIGGAQILSILHSGNRFFVSQAISRVTEIVFIGVAGYVLSRFFVIGLVSSYLIGYLSTVIVLFFKTDIKFGFYKVKELLQAGKENSQYPANNILQSLIDSFLFTGITIFIGYRYGIAQSGFYALCIRLLQAPFGLIIKPIAMVYYSRAAIALKENNSVLQLTRNTIRQTLFIVIPFVAVVLLASPLLFGFLFGAGWEESGNMARILIFWIAVDFVRAPIAQLSIIFHRQRQMLVLSITSAVFILSLMLVSFYISISIFEFLALITLSQMVYCLLITGWMWKLASKHSKE